MTSPEPITAVIDALPGHRSNSLPHAAVLSHHPWEVLKGSSTGSWMDHESGCSVLSALMWKYVSKRLSQYCASKLLCGFQHGFAFTPVSFFSMQSRPVSYWGWKWSCYQPLLTVWLWGGGMCNQYPNQDVACFSGWGGSSVGKMLVT